MGVDKSKLLALAEAVMPAIKALEGDSPSRPCLYRPTEAEERQRKERIAAYHAAQAEALA